MDIAYRNLCTGSRWRNRIPLWMLIAACAALVSARQCLAGSAASFVNISYQWQNFASARDVVVDVDGHAWFVGDRAHVFHYDPDTGVYELQNGVSLNNSSLEYTSIDFLNNSRKLIVVGNGGVWEADLPPLAEPQVVDLAHSGSMILEFDSIAGVNYLLQYSIDLDVWINENFVIQGLGQTETIVASGGPETSKFYRIVIAE